MRRILKYILADMLRNRIILIYTLLLALFSWSIFSLEDNPAKGILSLLNIILLVVPLVSVLFSTIYLYNSAEFIELLLSQPVARKKIWNSMYFGLSGSLVFAFLAGTGIPLLLFVDFNTGIMMLVVGILITFIFVALAFLSSILSRDKARGIGIAIMLWLFFALLFDGLVLFLVFQFADYPIEHIMVGVTALSPIDLARILILMQLDASAMMGYTGAVFRDFFGSDGGLLISFVLLLLWAFIPFRISLYKFKRKDL